MRPPFFPVATAFLAVAFALCGVSAVRADEVLRQVQQSLRDQGFYYGSIDGSPGDETTQAIKRYQIRNGLAVTGALNDETRAAIARTGGGGTGAAPTPRAAGNGSSSSRPTAPAAPAATPPPLARDRAAANDQPDYRLAPRPPVQPTAPSRGNPAPSVNGDDEETTTTAPAPGYGGAPQNRPDLRVYPPSSGGAPNPPPAPYGAAPSPNLTDLFAQSPYEFAPPAVQADILRRAQGQLLRSGFYDGETDGIPGPQTSEAIANFQQVYRLRRTARLDFNTLATMRLLPPRRPEPPRYYAPRPGAVYEGRIVR